MISNNFALVNNGVPTEKETVAHETECTIPRVVGSVPLVFGKYWPRRQNFCPAFGSANTNQKYTTAFNADFIPGRLVRLIACVCLQDTPEYATIIHPMGV